jgi:hypothetical protein
MTENKTQTRSNTGGATNSVPQNPLAFLASYAGKKVKLRAAGIFNDIIYDREYVARAMDRYEYVEGEYKVDVARGLTLRYPRHIINVIKLRWVVINGRRVVSKSEE